MKLDHQVVLEMKVPRVQLVLLDLSALLDLLVSLDQRDLRVKKDHPVSQEDQVTKDPPVMLAHLDHPDLQECQ